MTENTRVHEYVVLGAGAGGLVVAIGLLKAGKDVLVISKNIGGDCTHFGCVPSKTLLHLAKAYTKASEVEEKNKLKRTALEKVQQLVNKFIGEEKELIPAAQFLKGTASFLDENTLMVESEQGQQKATFTRKCIIATGSSPKRISIPGISEEKLVTNEEFFYLSKLPRSVTIIGGGPIGAELATACAQFGITTYLLSKSFLPKELPTVAAKSLKNLQIDGVQYIAARPKSCSNGKLLLDNEETIPETELYISAVGREANTALNLEKAGVLYDEKGIVVSKNLLTSNAAIFAIGDCTQNPQFTHLAAAHGRFVLKKLFFPLAKRHNFAVPRVTFTNPPVASVGELEENQGGKLFELDIAGTDRARTQFDTHSYGAVVIDTRTGRIKGATLLGESSEDLISFFTLVIEKNVCILEFLDYCTPYPTTANVIEKLATEYLNFLLKNWKKQPVSSFIQLLSYALR